MDTAQVGSWMEQAQPILVAFGLKVIGAIIVFIVGRWLIHLVTRSSARP
jgi:small conductance mechanosensitive channel